MVADPQQYWFLPMYDGKPPLFMWVLIPFLNLTPLDPLFSARILTIISGLLVAGVVMAITYHISGRRSLTQLAGLIYLLLPYSFFHDRLAVIDTWFTLMAGLAFWGFLKLKERPSYLWLAFSGLFTGAALMSKTPGLFLLPLFGLLPFLPIGRGKYSFKSQIVWTLAGLGIGLGLFAGLKVSPLFPFLFTRSSDFTFTLQEWLTGGWRHSFENVRMLGRWLMWYLTPIGFTLMLGALLRKENKQAWSLLLLGVGYALPFLTLGKVLFSRYFFPLTLFFIPLMALGWQPLFAKKPKLAWGIGILFVGWHIWFSLPLYQNPAEAHLPREDVKQYLTEWSSGYGIEGVREFIAQEAIDKKIVIGTEGYFGTLPDGLLMYYDRSPLIQNLEIFGVGQPITSLNPTLKERAKEFPTYIVVNEERLKMHLDPCCTIINRYPRPRGGSDLLLVRINDVD